MPNIKAPVVDLLLASGQELTTKITIPDQIQWSRTSRARGWDPKDEFLATLFTAWHSLKRTAQYSGTWEEFSETDAEWIQERKDDDAEDEPTEQDPTALGS